MMYWNAVLLSEFHNIVGTPEKAAYYEKIAKNWLEAVTAVLWHEEVGVWLDYDMSNSVKRDYFYPSNIAPLWTGCYKESEKDKIVRLVLKYLQNKNIMMYPGGIPTTVEHTGEQWDYPNAWPPLQHMMVVGLNNTGDPVAQRLAFEIAETWVRSNYKAYKSSNTMFEKVLGCTLFWVRDHPFYYSMMRPILGVVAAAASTISKKVSAGPTESSSSFYTSTTTNSQ